MSEETPLDKAHSIMMAAPELEDARLAFYALLADTEIFLLLESEPEADMIDPRVVDLDDAKYVLGFDSAARLTSFANAAAPYAAVSGRVLADILSGEGVGLALNLSVAPSSIMLPNEAMNWMKTTLGEAPKEQNNNALGALVWPNVPEVLLHTLDAKLVRAAGLAKIAYLCGREDGSFMLAILGAAEPDQKALAKAAGEALVFTGLDDLTLDVAFFNDTESLRDQFSRVGLRFEVPEPVAAKAYEPQAPGSDPSKPPKLR